MKKYFGLLLFLVTFTSNCFSTTLNATFSTCTFDVPGKSSALEIYLSVVGSSVKFVGNEKKMLQGKIEVQWVLKKNDSIVYFDKYNLMSPEIDNNARSIPDFLDQQRISVGNGKYVLELKIADKNSGEQSFTATQNIIVSYPKDKITVSDIELLESYTLNAIQGKMTKSGYDLVPFVYNFYPTTLDKIKFYAEIYGTQKILGDEDFLVRYHISNFNNHQVINELAGFKKFKASEVNVILAEFPIQNLASGNYNLAVEVRSKSNELLGYKKIFFQRSHTIEKPILQEDYTLIDIKNTFVENMTNQDSLREYINCLRPISGRFETQVADNQMEFFNVQSMQQLMFYFWQKRDLNNPGQAWANYKIEVDKVNVAFSVYNKKGYESDRGRVYLQHGAPNSMEGSRVEPDSYPYEIWQYNNLERETNRKFVFYCHDSASNDYKLLHSDATGEVHEPQWVYILHRGQSDADDYNNDLIKKKDTYQDGFGEREKTNYDFPK